MPNLCILKLNITHSVTKDLRLVMLEIQYFFAFTCLLNYVNEHKRLERVSLFHLKPCSQLAEYA